ncbi:MAG: 7-carboxy-7-deazaguanine synthase QueE [Candidatus Aminicenantes bacterium]|jgi:7-cyano-7-deazaguanosine (preQ0) biosynthesis protein QueE
MPQPPTLKITEIFPSIQGEGLRSGEPTIFIRLTGCNLRCGFCDTKYAWQGGEDHSVERILETIQKIKRRYPADWVCLTGGEPLIQPMATFVEQLKSSGFKVQIETNGTYYRPLAADWWTLSPKPPSYEFAPEYTTKAKEVKLVVSRELTLEVTHDLRQRFPARTPILLQPQSQLKWSTERALKLLKDSMKLGLKNIRLGIQYQKYIGVR